MLTRRGLRGAYKDATVKRFYDESHDQLRRHLADFVAVNNFDRRLNTLNGLTPDEFIRRTWASQPEQFTLNPNLRNKKAKRAREAGYRLPKTRYRWAPAGGWITRIAVGTSGRRRRPDREAAEIASKRRTDTKAEQKGLDEGIQISRIALYRHDTLSLLVVHQTDGEDTFGRGRPCALPILFSAAVGSLDGGVDQTDRVPLPPHAEIPSEVFQFGIAAASLGISRIYLPLVYRNMHVPGGADIVQRRFVRRGRGRIVPTR